MNRQKMGTGQSFSKHFSKRKLGCEELKAIRYETVGVGAFNTIAQIPAVNIGHR